MLIQNLHIIHAQKSWGVGNMFGMRFVYTEDRSRMESTIQRIKDRRKAEREQALEQNENDKTKRK
jgi:hypothetical protein